MKVGILIQRAFVDKFEAKALLESFKNKGFLAELVIVEELNYVLNPKDNENPVRLFYKGKDLKDSFDVFLVREIFSKLKHTILAIKILRKSGALVIDNNLEREQYVVNKLREGTELLLGGVRFPKTYAVLTLEEYLDNLSYIKDFLGYPLLVKHNSRGKGSGIFKVENEKELVNLLKKIHQEDPKKAIKRYHLQEFLYLEADYRVLVVGEKVLGAMQRIPKKGEFRANFSLGGSVKPVDLTHEMEQIANKAIRATNTVFAGVDIVYTLDNTYYVLEVNRTPGFEGFTNAHGINVADKFVEYVTKRWKKRKGM